MYIISFLSKLFPIKNILNKVKIRDISNKTFLSNEVIGIVKHGQNPEHVNSHLDLFVYKVEQIKNLYHVHCNFAGFDRILVVNQDYLKYIRFY